MRLSTFSSSLRVVAFIFAAAATSAALEYYCRTAARFQGTNYTQIKHFMRDDPTNAVFGDSHVLWISHIPGFSFFGSAGQQPAELNRIVRYLYASTKPNKIIIEADPQWLGRYHKDRAEFLTDENLASRIFPLVLTSAYYYKPLKSNLVSTAENTIINLTVPSAKAGAGPQKTVATDGPETRWTRLVAEPGFNWSWMNEEDRSVLTKIRVAEQNPIDGFASSPPAQLFRDAVNFLLESGATICLFRTPVTADYIKDTETTPNSNFESYEEYIRSFSKQRSIKYVDFRDLDYDFSDDKFLNSDHMTNDRYAEVWPLAARACFGDELPLTSEAQSQSP